MTRLLDTIGCMMLVVAKRSASQSLRVAANRRIRDWFKCVPAVDRAKELGYELQIAIDRRERIASNRTTRHRLIYDQPMQ